MSKDVISCEGGGDSEPPDLAGDGPETGARDAEGILAEDGRLEEVAEEACIETESMAFVDSNLLRAEKFNDPLNQTTETRAGFWAYMGRKSGLWQLCNMDIRSRRMKNEITHLRTLIKNAEAKAGKRPAEGHGRHRVRRLGAKYMAAPLA
ncbi:hypothetical protein P691DRAFT_787866 [Macrolepiota fuliginosa MF-IS2]|uniref:Uncharacterized protein n=1 Tax=Macrolepiota fuliginosa MF-IS2 TaxID=1400762 RepID=A0A9P6BX23_9AGAR|nr:hypothetical protein P691DRAFT_787866 [Macrolepiota fuliginosa MF-IS2]